jgi:hypothetical protein
MRLHKEERDFVVSRISLSKVTIANPLNVITY